MTEVKDQDLLVTDQRNMVHFVFLCSVFIFLLKQGESCEGDDWVRNDGNCYKIFTDVVNKSVAESTCLEHRSALASISNVAEHSFLVTHLTQINTSQENFWIGLHKIGNELIWNNRGPAGNLLWIDASVSSSTESNDCFIFNSARVLPFQCSSTASFVCEQWNVSAIRPTSCPEGTQIDFLHDKCVWFTHMPLSKAGAEVICSLKQGRLLKPRGEFFPFNLALIFFLPSHNRTMTQWTSLVVRNGSFLFEDGTEFNNTAIMLRRGEGECVALVVDGTQFELHQKPCLEEAAGLCEMDMDGILIDLTSMFETENDDDSNSPEASCPKGNSWKEHRETGFCYWETSYETSRLSWEDARKYCRSFGGDLASFQTAEEEEIGLHYQYGSTEHAYWIGLRYDPDTDSYIWSDGSPLTYQNWDEGQPNHVDRRRRCAYMSSVKKKWILSYCGILSWFICKAPKQINPPEPVPPTPEPLMKCPGSGSEYFFNDYCYMKVSRIFGWHRAQQFCEDRQSNLLSLHSESEVDFFIILLQSYDRPTGNRVWIGLNSLGLGGSFRWTDGSPVDFTHWDNGEPNNFQNQEKCVSMYSGHGMWNDENCNAVMNFVCKRRNGTFETPSTTTPAPMRGYCQNGWYMFGDRCFLPVGFRSAERKNWNEAGMHCLSLGGYLASIRKVEDQAFMFYLIQSLKMDTWLGLHDSIHSGVFYWTDNSPLSYTNWAPGEPSSRGFQEDCAVISFGGENSGKWADTDCQRVLPYVCQTPRDPTLTEPGEVRSTRCPHPPGYVKQGNSCYKLFPSPKTWEEAQATCRSDSAYLVSISDMENQAVVSYLATMTTNKNETIWIGLRNTGKYPLQWENKFPILFSRWGQNEPSLLPDQDASCYYSSASGYWKGVQCSEKKPFICHHTGDKPPKPEAKRQGPCPDDKSSQWYEVGNSCLHFASSSPAQWYTAKFNCAAQGSHLVSFHSMDELNTIKYFMDRNFRDPFLIGLVKNSEGGFQWSDGSPVDFANWDQDEPRSTSFRCVAMRMDTMKWKAADCYSTQNYICAKERGNITSTDSGKQIASKSKGMNPGIGVAIFIGLVILVAVAVVVILRIRSRKKDCNRYHVHVEEPIRSFENQSFDDLNSRDIYDRNVLFMKD